MKVLAILMMISLISCSTHRHHKTHKHLSAHHQHRFNDAKKWEKVFEDQKRDQWQKPFEVLKVVGIKKNSKVADIGSATGYFPVRIARIASKGMTWGIDVEPNLVRFLNERKEKEKIKNLYSILGTYSDPLIPEKVDFIFLVDTYHHIADRKNYFSNLRKYLTRNGRLIIIDWKDKDLPIGPKHDKISKQRIIKELSDSGYSLYKESDILEYQNFLIFK